MTDLPRIAYFDCFSGVSGDMILGAIVDAGLPLEELQKGLNTLPLRGYALSAERQVRHGLSGTKGHGHLDGGEQPQRHLADIEGILEGGQLPDPVRERARAVFRRLARAEAQVHGTTVDEVHFHEVGAVDAIVDVVGTVLGLHLLGVQAAFWSPLPLGGGFVHTAHGCLPVPAPATLALRAEAEAPTYAGGVQTELVTPTGAALMAECCRFERPSMALTKVGYGFGSKELPWPNALRLWLGRQPDSWVGNLDADAAILLECNLDDCPGQTLGYVMEELLREGALDVWFTPIFMKKNRPATLLSLLARPADAPRLARRVLEETTTLGLRQTLTHRWKAPRETATVETAWGPVRVKVKRLEGRRWSVWPEFEDCARIARTQGLPLDEVQRAAREAALRSQSSDEIHRD